MLYIEKSSGKEISGVPGKQAVGVGIFSQDWKEWSGRQDAVQDKQTYGLGLQDIQGQISGNITSTSSRNWNAR